MGAWTAIGCALATGPVAVSSTGRTTTASQRTDGRPSVTLLTDPLVASL